MEQDLLKLIDSYRDYYVEIRRKLHRCPELGFELYETVKIIYKYLDEMGVEYKKNIGKIGIVGELKGKNQNLTIALRADMDGLPIKEKNDVEYSSQNEGKMHACGHDAHTAILLGVAKILSLYKDKLPCNVRFIFQPAEETTGGAKPMIEDGALEGVDYIFGLHVDEELDYGQIGIKYGAVNASSTDVKIEVEGKSCHGAYPSDGVDAIVIMANIIIGIQSIISRNTDAREALVINLGKIYGGTKENIVPQNVVCSGTMRTLSEEIKESSKQRIEEMVKYIAKAYGGKGIVEFKDGYSALINNDQCVDIVKESGINIVGISNIEIKKRANMGVEDFAYFAEKVPGAFFTLGVKNVEKGIIHPAHNDRFDVDERALALGVKMQIANIFNTVNLILKSEENND